MNRNISMARKGSGRRGRAPRGLLLAGGIVLGIALVAGAVFIALPAAAKGDEGRPAAKKTILQAWTDGRKEEVLEMTRASCACLPFDPFYLSFRGISAYYISLEREEGDERQGLMDEAVFSIRKALASARKVPIRPQIEYVLGKAYFQKGSPWYDLSVKYLEASIRDGYRGSDTEEYVALAYAGLENHGKAAEHFEVAMKRDPSDVLMLSAAVSYKQLGNLEKTSTLLSGILEKSKDAVVLQRSRAMLAEMALNSGDYRRAEELLVKMTETDPGSAEAWFLLGNVYSGMKDPIKARAAWRKAIGIDPNHAEARKKLAERL